MLFWLESFLAHMSQNLLIPFKATSLLAMNGKRLPVKTFTGIKDEFVRAALLCVSCDLPAAQKTCGFLGHSAKLSCSKCF